MSTPPARSYSICQPMTDPQEDADRFFELMKTADDKHVPGDDDRSTVGVNPNQYPDPPDRDSGVATAPWGESDGVNGEAQTAQHHSNAAWDGFRKSREAFLKRHFDAFGPSAENSSAVLSQHLDHFKSGDHESGGPLNRGHSKRNPEVVETVLEKTRRLLEHS